MRINSTVLITIGVFMLSACATNPHKAKKIETELEKGSEISGDSKVGIKDGNLVVQKKVEMNEELRRLQNRVFGLEDRVYGNRKYGSKGLYGALKECRLQVTSKENGGTGKLTRKIPSILESMRKIKLSVSLKSFLWIVSSVFVTIAEYCKNAKMSMKRSWRFAMLS
jgi:hypothetical protein